MQKTGTLSIFQSVSRVDGTLIIKGAGSDPRLTATKDLKASGFEDNDPIKVTGSNDTWLGESAINMTSAQSPDEESIMSVTTKTKAMAGKKGGAKKSAEKQRASKKGARKKRAPAKPKAKKSGKQAAKKRSGKK